MRSERSAAESRGSWGNEQGLGLVARQMTREARLGMRDSLPEERGRRWAVKRVRRTGDASARQADEGRGRSTKGPGELTSEPRSGGARMRQLHRGHAR